MEVIAKWFSGLISLFSTFRVTDLIDIVIIAVLIYGILKFVRQTRAEQLLKGIVFVLLFYAVASILQLAMVTSIIKILLEFSVIILVVVFQPEIRKALEQLGRSKITKGYFKKIFQGTLFSEEANANVNKAISDVADSAILFSHTRTGALIVFERDTKLTDIATTGTVLNCDTSTAIFGNVFFNKAPLHDGACIIRDGKIFAAGCILPLNSKEVQHREIGTRHRAAIGMSEVSDAVVVVVSEETGQISLAVDGVLTRDYTRDSLAKTLEEMLISDKDENDKKIFKKRKVKKSNEK